MNRPAVAGLGGLFVLGACLEAFVAAGGVSPLIVPLPSDVLLAVIRLVAEESLLHAFFVSLAEATAATAIAILLGVPLGYLLSQYRVLGLAYENWLGAMFAAPMVLLYPLFLVMLGRTHEMVVLMGVITGIVPIIVNARIGLANVPRTWLNVGRVFNVSPSQRFWKIMLPAAVPTIFTGIRLGLIYALVNIIGIEFLIDFGGLGRQVSEMFDRFDVPGMYAAILFIVAISMLLLFALKCLQGRLRAI